MSMIKINTKKIAENFNSINRLCSENNKELMVITKCIKSNARIVADIVDSGATSIGDISAENLKGVKSNIKKMLMKVPNTIKSISDADFEFFYLSEIKILKNLSEIMGKRRASVILPIELGELREGIPIDEIIKFVGEAIKIRNIKLLGISGNFGCMAGLVPDKNKIEILIDVAEKVKRCLGYEFEMISIGGTIIYDCLKNKEIPKQINHIRMGEGIFTGRNTSMNRNLDGLHNDSFILSGEILELRYKNTDINGNYGFNAFGERLGKDNLLVNRGLRKRAIIDFGFLVGRNEKIRALDDGVRIVGNSYDCTVVDIDDSNIDLKVGDSIDFYADYNAITYAMMSSEMDKVFIK